MICVYSTGFERKEWGPVAKEGCLGRFDDLYDLNILGPRGFFPSLLYYTTNCPSVVVFGYSEVSPNSQWSWLRDGHLQE